MLAPASDDAVVRPVDPSFLHHRGPDGFGEHVWHDPQSAMACRLVHSRLAIRDLTDAGLQPCFNEDRTIAVTFNGEIYNYAELRSLCESRGHVFRSHMDGEVIPHLWEEFGPAGLARLNGIFAIALLDTKQGELVLARDPLGVKPLCYVADGPRLFFASEPNGLRALGCELGGQDLVGAAKFLTLLWVPTASSPYASVINLPPGQMVRHDLGSGRRVQSAYGQSFVDLARAAKGTSDPGELAERVRSAIQRQLVSDVPVGLMASGGVDSSMIWHGADGGIDTAYTIDWRGFREGGIDQETASVDALGRSLHTQVVHVPPSTTRPRPVSGELISDPAYELTRAIAAQASRDGVKVLLSGQGGDEVFGGYRRHVIAKLLALINSGPLGRPLERFLARLPFSLRAEFAMRIFRASAERDPFARYMRLCSYSTADQRARVLQCGASEVSDEVVWAEHRAVWDQAKGLSYLRRALLVDLLVYMPGLGLMYADRAGMEEGCEIRVPLLDLELVRWSLGLEDKHLVHRNTTKTAFRALAQQWLGDGIALRSKQGFGLPPSLVSSAAPDDKNLPFRQGMYFTAATEVLEDWRLDHFPTGR